MEPKFATFDLETAKPLPEDELKETDYGELGITCAAVAFTDKEDLLMWYKEMDKLSKKDCTEMVNELTEMVEEGYKLVTWNGTSFDFRVLAEESGMFKECANLALNHLDAMLYVTFRKGWYLGLQKALEGAGLEGKLKEVTLADGSILEEMSGAIAPELWFKGEHEAVLAYLEQDVIGLLQFIHHLHDVRTIKWASNAGNPQSVRVPNICTVKECFGFSVPDTSWMDDPPTRKQFVKWMPEECGVNDICNI